jgi:hypothetical protein
VTARVLEAVMLANIFRSSCEPADVAVQKNDAFISNIKRARSYKQLTQKYGALLENADGDTLRKFLDDTLHDAEAIIKRRHEGPSRVHLFGRQMVNFMYAFSAYLDAYGGIIEVMKQASGHYGKIAYNTLSVFLIVGPTSDTLQTPIITVFKVAVGKKMKEDKISETLRRLHNQFARFKILEKIHSTENMKAYVAEVYRLGIEFAREATYYYLKPALGRSSITEFLMIPHPDCH